jgi:hypothetical protein
MNRPAITEWFVPPIVVPALLVLAICIAAWIRW